MLKKVKNYAAKTREVGIRNCISGFFTYRNLKKLHKKYNFDKWHLSPAEWRKYAQDVISYISEQGANVVVDLGCGTGGVIQGIKTAGKRYGYDINPEPIEAAKELYGNEDGLIFGTGSFESVRIEEPVDYLITLGFIHGSHGDTWRPAYAAITKQNDIRHIIADTVPVSLSDEANHHDLPSILPDNYSLLERKGPYTGGRYIEIYKKTIET